MFLVAAITFFAMHCIPGGPFDTEKATDPATKAALLSRFHLDKSVPEQFWLYLGGALRGDFGISLKTGREVSEMVFGAFGVSARLGALALLVALPLGVGLGCLAAVKRGRAGDRAVLALTTLLMAVPSFVVATLLLLVFCLKLGWFGVWSAEWRRHRFARRLPGALPHGLHRAADARLHAGGAFAATMCAPRAPAGCARAP